MKNILKNIIENKLKWIADRKKRQPLISFKHTIKKSNCCFQQSLKHISPAFILEVKFASPSLGIIKNNYCISTIAKTYKKYASSISVLTDEQYFNGNFEFIPTIKQNLYNQPVLCKDFFIDPYQIYLARYYQADAILLMLSVLNNFQYIYLKKIAYTLNMQILTEINNTEELNRALALDSKIVGINNRDLRDFSINIEKTKQLAPLLPNNIIKISESGINNYNQIRMLKPLVDGFLIGSSLMTKKNLKTAICQLTIGKNKICGLKRLQDVKIIKKIGATYGGLIFCKSSQRYINHKKALNIVNNIKNIKFVGVFCNESISKIRYITNILSLYAIQLHGTENQSYINDLKNILPKNIKIWKAISLTNNVNYKYMLHGVDKYVFDNANGGSGKQFNWMLLKKFKLNHVILAGGLNISNCILASNLGCYGLDFNSGVEISPGIKDIKKINLIFHSLRVHETCLQN